VHKKNQEPSSGVTNITIPFDQHPGNDSGAYARERATTIKMEQIDQRQQTIIRATEKDCGSPFQASREYKIDDGFQ